MRVTLTAVCAAAAMAASLPAAASVVTYFTTLSGAAEIPPNASPGTGSATVTYDDSTSKLSLHVEFTGLIGTTTASHIHCCTAAAGAGTAGVATTTPTFAGFPLGVHSGIYDALLDLDAATSWNPGFISSHGATIASAKSDFLTGLSAGKTYLNVHSTFAPGGEIRGFLQQVPEPASYGLALGGLAMLALARRRRPAN